MKREKIQKHISYSEQLPVQGGKMRTTHLESELLSHSQRQTFVGAGYANTHWTGRKEEKG